MFGSVRYLRNNATAVASRISNQVRLADGHSGPDLVEFLDDGLVIVQFKSFSRLGAVLGASGAQVNISQLVTDMARMHVAPGRFEVPDAALPAAMGAFTQQDRAIARQFSGKYVSAFNLEQYNRSGPDGLAELWEMGARRIEISLDVDHLPLELRQFATAELASMGHAVGSDVVLSLIHI